MTNLCDFVIDDFRYFYNLLSFSDRVNLLLLRIYAVAKQLLLMNLKALIVVVCPVFEVDVLGHLDDEDYRHLVNFYEVYQTLDYR